MSKILRSRELLPLSLANKLLPRGNAFAGPPINPCGQGPLGQLAVLRKRLRFSQTFLLPTQQRKIKEVRLRVFAIQKMFQNAFQKKRTTEDIRNETELFEMPK